MLPIKVIIKVLEKTQFSTRSQFQARVTSKYCHFMGAIKMNNFQQNISVFNNKTVALTDVTVFIFFFFF